MTTVVFIPDLLSPNDLTAKFCNRSLVGHEDTAHMAAKQQGCAFIPLNYQSLDNQNPLFSSMESRVLEQLEDILFKKGKKQPILAVGDGFGFGVLVGALSRLGNFTSQIALLGVRPVLDPLQEIEQRLRNANLFEGLRDSVIPGVKLPLKTSQKLKDCFSLSAAHLNDEVATRILKNSAHAVRFAQSSTNIHSSTLIYGHNDPLTPQKNMEQFASAVAGAPTKLVALDTNHFSLELSQQIPQMIAKLG